MRLRWLALFPLLLLAVVFAVFAALFKDDPQRLDQLVMGQRILVRALALGGCLWAVSVFERGDDLRHAWGWLAANTALVLTRDVLLIASLPTSHWLSYALVVLSNVALPIGIWLLVRSWRQVAVDAPAGRSWTIILGVVVLALVVSGSAVVTNANALLEGKEGALIFFVSAVGDTLSFCLLGPLLLAAIELRGGLLSWPWALVAACLFSWMLFDAAVALEPKLVLSYPELKGFPLREVFRGVAGNFLFAAGMAQALVVRQVRRIAR